MQNTDVNIWQDFCVSSNYRIVNIRMHLKDLFFAPKAPGVTWVNRSYRHWRLVNDNCNFWRLNNLHRAYGFIIIYNLRKCLKQWEIKINSDEFIIYLSLKYIPGCINLWPSHWVWWRATYTPWISLDQLTALEHHQRMKAAKSKGPIKMMNSFLAKCLAVLFQFILYSGVVGRQTYTVAGASSSILYLWTGESPGFSPQVGTWLSAFQVSLS